MSDHGIQIAAVDSAVISEFGDEDMIFGLSIVTISINQNGSTPQTQLIGCPNAQSLRIL